MRDAALDMLQAIMELVQNNKHLRLLCEQILHKKTTKGEHSVLSLMLGTVFREWESSNLVESCAKVKT